MAVDKRITYRRNFKGGADASMADFGSPSTPGVSAGRTGPGPNVSAGGASFNDLGPGPSGDDFRRSRTEFIDKFNQDRARDFKPTAFRRTYKPIGLDKFGSSNQLGAKGGIRNLFKALLGFAVPGASFLFNKGKQGIKVLMINLVILGKNLQVIELKRNMIMLDNKELTLIELIQYKIL